MGGDELLLHSMTILVIFPLCDDLVWRLTPSNLRILWRVTPSGVCSYLKGQQCIHFFCIYHLDSWVRINSLFYRCLKSQSEGRSEHTFSAFLLSNSVSFWDLGNTQTPSKQSEKLYETKKTTKIISILTSFLPKIDIYANNPSRPVTRF